MNNHSDKYNNRKDDYDNDADDEDGDHKKKRRKVDDIMSSCSLQ